MGLLRNSTSRLRGTPWTGGGSHRNTFYAVAGEFVSSGCTLVELKQENLPNLLLIWIPRGPVMQAFEKKAPAPQSAGERRERKRSPFFR